MKIFQCLHCKCTVYGYNNLIHHQNLHRQRSAAVNKRLSYTSSVILDPSRLLYQEIEDTDFNVESEQDVADDILDEIEKQSFSDPPTLLFQEIEEIQEIEDKDFNVETEQDVIDDILDQIENPGLSDHLRSLYEEVEEDNVESDQDITDDIINQIKDLRPGGENDDIVRRNESTLVGTLDTFHNTDIFDDIQDSAHGNALLPKGSEVREIEDQKDFSDIVDSSFHESDSLLEGIPTHPVADQKDFSYIVDSSFHGDDSLLEGIPADHFMHEQYGAGIDDYTIRVVKEKELKNMGAKDINYGLTFNKKMFTERRKLKDVLGILKGAFKEIIDQGKRNLRPGDIMRLVLHNDALDVPIFVPCRPMEEMNADAALDAVVNVLNSEEGIPFDSSTQIDVGVIKYPRGGHSIRITNVEEAIKRKTSILAIHNNDNFCLLRAVIMAHAYICKGNHIDDSKITEPQMLLRHGQCSLRYYRKLKENKSGSQDEVTNILAQEMNIKENVPLSYEVIPRLEDYFNVNIYVVSSRLGNSFSYVSSGSDTERKKLFLYHVHQNCEEHFHSIVKIAGFFGQSYFCQSCLKPYASHRTHRCLSHCNVCLSDQCVKQQERVCSDCNRTCRSAACYLRHRKISDKGTTPCQFFYKCLSCHKTFETKKLSPNDHKCGYYTCKSCQQYASPEHLCYARSTPDTSAIDRKYIFADIEASQRDEIVQCESGYAPLCNDKCAECQYERNCCQKCATCKHCLRVECGTRTPCALSYSPQPKDKCQECTFKRNKCKACQTCQNCLKYSCGQHRHTFVLAVCQTACSKCEEKVLDSESKCIYCGSRCATCSQRDAKTKQFVSSPCAHTCGYRERVFRTLYDLGSWIFHENHKGFTVMFHNLSYDGGFLMQYLLSQSMRPSFVIYRGSKIQMFNVQSLQIRVIDSFNFLPMALAKLPKAFQLDSLAKGYFPHFFTRREHLNYVGPYPPVHFYASDSMSLDDRGKFLEWYQNKVTSGEAFDFQKEMIKYCKSDVDILRRACMKFKNLLNDATGSDGGIKIDAFASCTIASLCMEVFKKKFLREDWKVLVGTPIAVNEARNNVTKRVDDKEKWLNAFKLNGKMNVFHQGCWKNASIFERQTGLKIKKSLFVRSPIARPSPNGYVSQVKFSKKSIQWLEWLMHRASVKGQIINIQHALNGRGEYKVPGTRYSLDGFVAPAADRPKALAYEFNGCKYHGCPTCYKNKDDVLNPNTGATASELFALTLIKEAKLREMGFKVVKIWECQFDSQCRRNDNLRSFIESLDIEDRLDPRDSLMGGRTNGSVLFKRTNAGSKIKYVDFTSLYPFINKNAKYPLYHPEIITGNVTDISSYFGIAKVKILPPRGLFHPVLGYKTGGKLTFPLCRSCVEKQQQTPCRCSEADRSFVGTYCTPEIEKAIEKGYKILKIYEIYHWPETTQYDPTTKTGGLFVEYINMFLKIKQEASGRPEWVQTEADLEKYIELYEEREGIRLDPQNVELNLGLRSLAKLLLNSFWGKFGQRMNLTKTQFIHDTEAHKLFGQMADPTVELVDFNIVNDETLMLSTKRTSEDVCDPGHTNVFLASFTTCWARLKLYELLDMLQTRALYWDTDSVIYLSLPGEPEPPTGDYLGELTDELGGSDTWIESLIVCGPKNYAYKTNTGKEVCKVKGFSLNYGNSQVLNFESMQDAMFNRNDPLSELYTLTNSSKICRNKTTSELFSQEEIKKYACVYTKRVVMPNLTTLPYGY